MNIIDRALYRFPRYRKWRGLPEPMNPRIAEITRQVLAIAAEKAEHLGSLRIRQPNQYVRRSDV